MSGHKQAHKCARTYADSTMRSHSMQRGARPSRRSDSTCQRVTGRRQLYSRRTTLDVTTTCNHTHKASYAMPCHAMPCHARPGQCLPHTQIESTVAKDTRSIHHQDCKDSNAHLVSLGTLPLPVPCLAADVAELQTHSQRSFQQKRRGLLAAFRRCDGRTGSTATLCPESTAGTAE